MEKLPVKRDSDKFSIKGYKEGIRREEPGGIFHYETTEDWFKDWIFKNFKMVKLHTG